MTLRTLFVAGAGALALLAQSLPADASTVTFATPGDPRTNPIETKDVSTTFLDQFVGAGAVTSAVNAAFSALATFETQSEAGIAAGLLSASEIKQVFWVDVKTAPLALTFSQAATTIALNVSGIDISYRVKAEGGLPLFCSSVKFTADITVEATGNFSYSTGNLTGLSSSQTLNKIRDVSCGGVLSFLTNLIAKPFIKGMIESKVSENLQLFGQVTNVLRAFSLSDIVLPLPPSLGLGHASDMVLQVAGEIFNRTSQNKGLNLKAELWPNLYGPGNHQVTFTAFNSTPQVFTTDFPLVWWSAPASVSFDIYTQPSSGLISFRMSTSSTAANFSDLTSGTKILVVGKNRLIPSLKSFPGIGVVPQNSGSDCIFDPLGCQQPL